MAYEANVSYEVTAAKRRPRRFEELVGQDFVTATLKNSVENGQIAHAYLFSGPRGCGKTSTARILAKMLNCAGEKGSAPCGECSACAEIARGASMDVIEIDGASNTSVNDVRQIKDEVLFPPNSLKYKIYIIDEVHMLSTSAFNALLKTIEEPPPYVIFIFATTELHKVPATIKSRCQQFHFRLGSVEQIKNLLADAAREAGLQADDEALYWIARESTGSFRDAYTLFDQVAAFSEGSITYEKIRDKLGLVGIDRLNTLCSLCAVQNTQEALLFIDELLQSGTSIEQCVSNISDYLRSLLFIKTGITKEALLGNAVERYSKEVLDTWSASQLEKALSLFLQLYRDIRYSLNPRYELELAVERLCSLALWISRAEIKQAVDRAAHLLTGTAAPQTRTAQTGSFQTGSAQRTIASQRTVASQSAGGYPAADRRAAGESAAGYGTDSQSGGGAFQEPHLHTIGPQSIPPAGNHTAPETASVPEPAQHESAVVSQRTVAEQRTIATQSGVVSQGTVTPQGAVAAQGEKARNPAELKEKTINSLAVSKAVLSAALSRTGSWSVSGGMLCIPVQTVFEQKQLQNEIALLKQTVSSLWSEALNCSVEIAAPQESPQTEQIPEQIRMICDTVQGKIEKREPKEG